MDLNSAESWRFILFFLSDPVLIAQDFYLFISSSEKLLRCMIAKLEGLHIDWPEVGEIMKLCRTLQISDMKTFFLGQFILTDEFKSAPVSEDRIW